MAVVEQAPFTSVRQALARSFGAESKSVLKSTSLYRGPSGSGDLTMHDVLAQSAMVRSLAMRILNEQDMDLVAAQYLPSDGRALPHKRAAEASVALRVGEEPRYQNLPLAFLDDTVRQWCGDVPRRMQKEWMDRMGVSSVTLWRLRCGNKANSGGGIFGYLDRWERRVLESLRASFEEKGVVGAPENN